jgi:hypothetical protein
MAMIPHGSPLLLLLAAGCAMAAPENRRTLLWLDDNLKPASGVARGALLPAAIPIGLAALAVDAVVVHPVTVVDDAWGDTVDLLWTTRGETPLRQALFAPIAALATPFVFAGDFLGRCNFAIAPRVAAVR